MDTASTSSPTKESKSVKGRASPMLPNITELSDEEVETLVSLAQAELAARRERRRTEFFESIRERARALGLDPEEVAAAFSRKGGVRAGATQPLPPKYRNPADASETWSGRGVKPKWMQALIAQGKKPEDFRIQA